MYRAAEEILKFLWCQNMKHWVLAQQLLYTLVEAWYVRFKMVELNFSTIGLTLDEQPPNRKSHILAVPMAIQMPSYLGMIPKYDLGLGWFWWIMNFSSEAPCATKPSLKSIEAKFYLFSKLWENRFFGLPSKATLGRSLNNRAPGRSYWTINLSQKKFVLKVIKYGNITILHLSDLLQFSGHSEVWIEVGGHFVTK